MKQTIALVAFATVTHTPSGFAAAQHASKVPRIGYLAAGTASSQVDQLGEFRQGTQPADIPVERPIKFDFVINPKTAKQIGLTIPPEVLARANRIIR